MTPRGARRGTTRPPASPAPWIPLIALAAFAAAVVWAMAPSRRTSTPAGAERSVPAPAAAVPPTANAPGASSRGPAIDPVTPGAPRRSERVRSPLERSPGYYPPDDPESMSVITGRREAKPVSLPFTGGAASREDLARMILAGLNARDPRTLHTLRVTKEEFGVILWPEFPQSRPVTHITLDDAWLLNLAQSAGGVAHTLGSYGGSDLGLVAVECDAAFPYANFTLYRNVVIVARDQVTGDVVRLRFAPSFAERLGRYKVLTYRD